MSGPYINKGNYMYGVNEYHQPCLPKYNSALHHKKPGIREIPTDGIRDDGMPYTYDSYYKEPDRCKTCNRCNKIARDSLMTSIINIESKVTKMLTITLYGLEKDLDVKVNLREGNKYCISYVTEKGIQTVTGRLRTWSPNLPDDCTKYIGNFNTVASSAYIGLDCSTDGTSDKRMIYIASIRYIEEIFDENDDPYVDLTQEEKLKALVTDITSTLTNINNYIESEKAKEEEKEDEEPSEEDECKPKPPKCPHHPPKHPFPNPFIPYGWYPYNGGPLIIDRRPYMCKPCPPPPGVPGNGMTNEEINNSITVDTIVEALQSVKSMINSFIVEYERDRDSEKECCGNIIDNGSCGTNPNHNCDIGTPLVVEVPHDAKAKDLYLVEVEGMSEDNSKPENNCDCCGNKNTKPDDSSSPSEELDEEGFDYDDLD